MLDEATIEEFRGRLRGPLLTPDDPSYDEARAVRNGLIDRHPEEDAMFGTIGHARLKSGGQPQLEALMQEWLQTIRPRIPGDFVQLVGHADGQPEDLVFVALAQDKATYQRLAQLPEQDAWFRRFTEQVEGDVRWEDVEMERIPS